MTDYTNWKILKTELDEKQEEYLQVAEWCNNSNGYFIDDSDELYYTVKKIIPSQKSILQEEYIYLQQKLKKTDYITNKLAEVVDDMDAYREMKNHYSEQLSQRKFWRQRIKEIENELKDLENES